MNAIYDVIIIGSGPSGASAGYILADKGYKVLLLEKFKLPRYKSCSGQIIRKTINLIDRYFGNSIPESCLCTPFENRGMILTNNKGIEFKFEQSGLNVWRSKFDYWLLDNAIKKGLEVRDQTAAIGFILNDRNVILKLRGSNIYSIKAKYIIDCEGVVGTIKRKLLNKNFQYVYTFQTYNKGFIELDPHYFYAYLQPSLSEYDAWFNVKDDYLVLGVSVKKPYLYEKYYKSFLSYMVEKHNLKLLEEIKKDKWLMPFINNKYEIDYGFERIFFAGEIAGFLNPMGEGISSGIESGVSIAQSISENFNDVTEIYNKYELKTKELHNYMKRQWNFVSNISDNFKDILNR